MSCAPAEWLCILTIPVPKSEVLGQDEHDFSNVLIKGIDMEGNEFDKPPKVTFFSTGKLGALRGGLCNFSDQRQILEKEDIQQLAEAEVSTKLDCKRTVCWGKHFHGESTSMGLLGVPVEFYVCLVTIVLTNHHSDLTIIT